MGRNRKYTLNYNYFDNIDSEYKAYFLGYLFADGYNQKSKGTIRLILSTKDEEILQIFAESIETNSPIKRENRLVKEKSYSTSGLYINSIYMCNVLESYGMTQNKSLTLNFPKINEQYLHHFIRGYFDGDGSINNKSQPKISICGSESFLLELKRIFEKFAGLNNVKLYKPKNNKIFYLEYGGFINVEKIYKFLYKESNLFLKRKYIKMYNFYGDRNNSKILNKNGDKLRNKASKLRFFSNEDVINIKILKKTMKIREIAKKYNKSESCICNILYKKNIYTIIPT